MKPTIDCAGLRERLQAYLEGTLDPAEREALVEHAKGCAGCGALVCRATKITCKEIADFLHEYVDGELPPDQRTVFHSHIELCPPCLDYLEGYKRTIRLASESCASEAHAPVPDALVRAILKARDAGHGRRG